MKKLSNFIKIFFHGFRNFFFRKKTLRLELWAEETISLILKEMEIPPVLYCDVVMRHGESKESFHDRMVVSLREWDERERRTDTHLELVKTSFWAGFDGSFLGNNSVSYEIGERFSK